MRKLIILTALAFAAIPAAGASAYLNVDNARFGAAATIGDVHKFSLGVRGYNPAAAYWATPASCFHSYWTGQFSNQGCYKRINDNWVRIQMGMLYFAPGNRPSGGYSVDVTGDNACFLVRSRDDNPPFITHPNGFQEFLAAFSRYGGGC